MKITICSSADFAHEIIEVKAELEKLGHSVNIPYSTSMIADGKISYDDYLKVKEKDGDILFRNAQQEDLIRRYWNIIREFDAILVLNLKKKGIENYIGGNTLMEMGFAYGFGKKIFLYNPIPQRSERMHYIDELIDMKPVVIHTDLGLI